MLNNAHCTGHCSTASHKECKGQLGVERQGKRQCRGSTGWGGQNRAMGKFRGKKEQFLSSLLRLMAYPSTSPLTSFLSVKLVLVLSGSWQGLIELKYRDSRNSVWDTQNVRVRYHYCCYSLPYPTIDPIFHFLFFLRASFWGISLGLPIY